MSCGPSNTLNLPHLKQLMMTPKDNQKSTSPLSVPSGEKRSHADSFEAGSDQEPPPAPKRADRVIFAPNEGDNQHLSKEGGNSGGNFEAKSNEELPLTPRRTSRQMDSSGIWLETSELNDYNADDDLFLPIKEGNT